MKVKNNRNTVVLRINPKIYKLQAIKIGIKDFKDVCHIKIIQFGPQVVLHMTAISKNDKKEIKSEFLNYVLSIMKNRGMV